MDIGFTPPILVRVLGCVCLCAGSASPPLPPQVLAGICGVCAWVQVSASPGHSWLAFLRCVIGSGFCFPPANPGWLAGVRVSVCDVCLYPTNAGLGLWCVCFGMGLAFTPSILAGVRGVCVWARF